MKRARKPERLDPVSRALIERQWHADAVSAQLHALIGGDSNQLVHKSGQVLFVVLGACLLEEVDPEMPEIRIIRGAVNAVHEQAGEPDIPPARRASIVSGLEACDRLIPELQRRSLITAACDLTLKMRRQHINYSDFMALIEQGATC